MKFLTRKKLLAALAIVLLGVGICFVWAAKSSRAEEKPVGIQVICSTNDAGQPQFTFQFTNRTERAIQIQRIDGRKAGITYVFFVATLQSHESKAVTLWDECGHGERVTFSTRRTLTRIEAWRLRSAIWLQGKGIGRLGNQMYPKKALTNPVIEVTVP